MAAFANTTGGVHTVELDVAPAPGQWLELTLLVRGQSSNAGVVSIWLAHHPGDINQDGVVDVRDATAFGQEFRGRRSPLLIDLNGDALVDIRDATTFGEIWHGQPPATRAWSGSTLPPKPE